MVGQIAVGRRITTYQHRQTIHHDPERPGFTSILCLTKSSPYGSLGPYVLKTNRGFIMENEWQFGKWYAQIPAVACPISSYNKQVAWMWPAETHKEEKDGSEYPNDAYWAWREAGMACPYPIRYPVGYKVRHQCLGYIKEDPLNDEYTLYDYVESRKQVYWPLYRDAVIKEPKFKELKRRYEQGENLLIIEVDTCHQESLEYYKEKYHVADDFIENNTMLVTEEALRIMIYDIKHPWGHGYALASALIGIELSNVKPMPMYANANANANANGKRMREETDE